MFIASMSSNRMVGVSSIASGGFEADESVPCAWARGATPFSRAYPVAVAICDWLMLMAITWVRVHDQVEEAQAAERAAAA